MSTRKTGWKWLVFKDCDGIGHTTAHAVQLRLIADVLKALKEKHGEEITRLNEEKCKIVEEFHLDLGGMLYTDTPIVRAKLTNGRTFSCWLHQAGEIFDRAQKLLEDESRHRVARDGTKYVKMFGAYSCVCLTLHELRKIATFLAKNREEYAKQEQVFFDRKERMIAKSPHLTSPTKMQNEALEKVVAHLKDCKPIGEA